LVNELGNVTETTIANVAVEVQGELPLWITPTVTDGLLPGVLRSHLLKCGELDERSISLKDLRDLVTVASFLIP